MNSEIDLTASVAVAEHPDVGKIIRRLPATPSNPKQVGEAGRLGMNRARVRVTRGDIGATGRRQNHPPTTGYAAEIQLQNGLKRCLRRVQNASGASVHRIFFPASLLRGT